MSQTTILSIAGMVLQAIPLALIAFTLLRVLVRSFNVLSFLNY